MKLTILSFSSSGSPDRRGESVPVLGSWSVGTVIFLTLSQLASISTPPASLKEMSQPRRCDWMHK